MNDDNEDMVKEDSPKEDILEDEPELDTVLEVEGETPKGVSRGFVIGGLVMSSLLGAGLGIAGTKILAGPDKAASLKIELEQSLEALQKSSDIQTKKLGATNSVQKKIKARLDKLQDENKSLAAHIKTLENRLTDLQKAVDDNDVKDIMDRIAVLEALSGTDTDVFSGADSIIARLDTLEEKIADENPVAVSSLPNAPSETFNQEDKTGNQEDKTGNQEDKTGTQKAITDNPVPERVSESSNLPAEGQSELEVLIDTFPREKLLAAVKKQEASAMSKPGWLRRALSKHIKVRTDEAVDPYKTIDAAEAALGSGDITAALAHIQKLNPPVRTSIAEWTQAAKKIAAQQ